MSIALMTRTWLLPLPASAKLVLLSLADQANDDGVCWPSQPKIAQRCSLTERAVRQQLKLLEDSGLISRHSNAGIKTIFRLSIPEEPRNDIPPRNDVPPRNDIPEPRNDVPPTPEYGSGDPGTTFRVNISKPKEPSTTVKKNTRAPKFDALAYLSGKGVDASIVSDWLVLRKEKRAPATLTAITEIEREVAKANITLTDALRVSCMRGWQAFNADWYANSAKPTRTPRPENFSTRNYREGINDDGTF